jgi:RsiW-degrading membrane proteinase PrsW (M82 family)
MHVLTAIVLAAFPTALYTMLIWWLDRYEKEPFWLVLIAFVWGAAPAIVLAVLFEFVLAIPLARSPLGPDTAIWSLAPLIEEPLKALALFGLFLWVRREIDGPLDGIVYGALIGFGFSMTENALYFMHSPDPSGLFLLRSVLFGLNHGFFTGIVGLSFGVIRYWQTRTFKVLALLGGLGLAVLFHGLHNFLVEAVATLGVVISWLVQSVGIFAVLAVMTLTWRDERRWMEQELGEEIRAGVIGPEDYADVLSSSRRIRRQLQALLNGGWTCFRRTRRLQHCATELAFCKSRVRLADRFQPCGETEELRREILALRAALEDQRRIWSIE